MHFDKRRLSVLARTLETILYRALHKERGLKPDNTIHIDMSKEVKKSYSPRQKPIKKQLKGYLSFTIALEAPLLLPVPPSPPAVPLPPPDEVRP